MQRPKLLCCGGLLLTTSEAEDGAWRGSDPWIHGSDAPIVSSRLFLRAGDFPFPSKIFALNSGPSALAGSAED
jgi:hypothetical protein